MKATPKMKKFVSTLIVWLFLLPQSGDAKDLHKCSDWKDAEFCSYYYVIKQLTSRLANERAGEGSVSFPLLIDITKSDRSDVNFYATFSLIKTLNESQELFFQSVDYYNWKRRLILQLFIFQEEFGDATRAQAYLLYLDTQVEPISSLKVTELAPLIGRETVPNDLLVAIKCFVLNDVIYLPTDKIEELASFQTCLNDS